MFPLFLIPVFIAAVAVCLYACIAEEIYRILALCICLLCTAIGLILAPWQIQGTVLVLALWLTRQFSLPKHNNYRV
ncbi:hypothetical protein [Geitlerinema sp. PCC 9228]|jgi:hypothetical protein|uniref:hypothetical protein n=1 Tax=Geitlerinema sp. PCC 9228 TaxID=111611 RepID=UPI0008F9B37E|nr:hypothetical protein [Geitlerinema sp. PCC 9228]